MAPGSCVVTEKHGATWKVVEAVFYVDVVILNWRKIPITLNDQVGAAISDEVRANLPLPCKRTDPEPPEEKQSTPENRCENQILPPVSSIDLRRWKDRASIPAEALSKKKSKRCKGSDHRR